MKTNKTLILFLILSGISTAGAAEVKNFSDVWSWIKADHPELKAASEELGAARSASNRSDLHWLPSLYFSGRGYSTNDPGQNFMGNLGSRAVTATDFSPDSLNRPGAHTFGLLSLGAELPIYEGGRSAAYSSMQKFSFQARENLNSAAAVEAYSQAVSLYAGVLNSNESLASLEELKNKVSGILSRYSLGSRSNPVGYSGLLGLKSILNRIEASINEIKLAKAAFSNELTARTNKLSPGWEPKKDQIHPFLQSRLPDSAIHAAEDSYSLTAGNLFAEMQNSKISIERSRFLPQLGLFAEGNYFTGARDSATAYTGGVYLRWSIFNPKDFGLVDESSQQYAAAQSRFEGNRINEKLAREQSIQTLEALAENEKLLTNSSELMSEQVATASRLFQSGSLNALQLVEVFNRRADLIQQLYELHKQQIQTRTNLARISRMKGVEL